MINAQQAQQVGTAHSWTQAFLRSWRDPAIRFPVGVFIVARVVTLLIAYMSVQSAIVVNPYRDDPIFVANLHALRLSGPIHALIEPWDRWDTGWYMKIALMGYATGDGTIIFAPMYPALSGAVGALVGDTLLGGLIVSSVSCLAFLLIFYRLVRLESGGQEQAAQNALILLITLPVAFYMLAAYTESTFMVGACGALLAARTRHWWLAAALAAFATLTRLQGWVLFFPIGWWAFVSTPRFWQAPTISLPIINLLSKLRQAIPRLVAMGSGPLMALFFLLYTSRSGLGTVDSAYSDPWRVAIRPPWESVISVIQRVLSGQAVAVEIINLIALLVLVLLIITSWRVLPIPYHLYSGLTLILVLMRYYSPTLLNGTMRYVLDFFPTLMALGIVWVHQRRLRLLWIAGGLTIGLTMLFLFARWLWIA